MRERMGEWAGWLAGPVVVGLVLGLAGPFGTFAALPALPRMGYWLAVVTLNWILCDLAIRRVEAVLPATLPLRGALVPLVGALVASVPATGVVTLAGGLSGLGWPGSVPVLYGQVLLLLCAIALPVYTIADLREAAARPEPAGATPAPEGLGLFQQRLDRPLEGQLWCLEMQDHYLKVHTSRESEMILCRMEDAARELGALGQRVHRSWWVAEAARAGVARDGQRLSVCLPDGRKVPVGRTYRPALRDAGWL